MEFPDLGEHCTEKTCKRLDFLPMKCDACADIFCKDHITYANHKCTSAYKKDVQVPVCPLCNTPIPVSRGEMPDIKVGEHIDGDCKSDPARRKRKIFTNKCSKGGCKQKEMIKVTCDQCHLNFCLKHRHPLDHECKANGHAVSKSGTCRRSVTVVLPPHQQEQQRAISPSASLQAGMTEEQALQRALEMSLAESARSTQQPLSPQEEEDLALAQALAASEEEFSRQQQQQRPQNREPKQSSCSVS
ncbi:AN1-type zinc finger protein 2A-like isoform X3 [Polyodon spathula]|uniref:AN1-type zinc finger protein 2A-like isoform X3 n=1 Tax=Polyodon spathula TaxID=7913 RepID=UPI001B7DADC5|nr:AN1-type zinc finger protein 2A-like isoform X3 [Polyodon spathula]